MLNPSRPRICRSHIGIVVLAVATAALPALAPAPVQASEMAGIGTSESVTLRATVQSVDPSARQLTLVGPGGETVPVTAGPAVINFDKIKAGDTVAVRYDQSTQFVLSPRGTKLPPASITAGAVGAAKGAMPAGAAGSKMVVTGVVVGIDAADHALQIVQPSGGAIRTVHVVSDDGIKHFGMIKVGDAITAVKTQAIAVSVQPAP